VRNRYLDLLRAAAIARVIVYHLFGWPWLSLLLPAMGVMFALAGSLTAASLDKRPPAKVITSRLRRLLPPLWLLGLIAVPVMLYAGWAHEHGDTALSVPRLLFWVLPLGDPPGSDKGIDAWEPLWYIRAYLWFVLLSPALYLAYRKLGWAAVAAPIVAIAVLDKTGFSLPDTADAAMWDFVTFGACWIAGFAHHDGRLARTRPGLVVAGAVALGAAALYWLTGHQGEDPWDLNDVTEAQALWSLAFVLVALRWQPPMTWLARIRPLDAAVSFLNARAVTIYLWHNIAIAAIWPVLTVVALDDLGRLDGPMDLAAAVLLTLLAVLAFGWVEDLAARRRPRLWPVGTAGRPVAAAAGVTPGSATATVPPAGAATPEAPSQYGAPAHAPGHGSGPVQPPGVVGQDGAPGTPFRSGFVPGPYAGAGPAPTGSLLTGSGADWRPTPAWGDHDPTAAFPVGPTAAFPVVPAPGGPVDAGGRAAGGAGRVAPPGGQPPWSPGDVGGERPAVPSWFGPQAEDRP
jgi:peptidoglycan/LPS O-acetylase OafA/YrhL